MSCIRTLRKIDVGPYIYIYISSLSSLFSPAMLDIVINYRVVTRGPGLILKLIFVYIH